MIAPHERSLTNRLARAIVACTATLVLGLAPVAAIAADWTLDQVFSGLAQERPAVTRFYEQRRVVELDALVESSGELEFKPPSLLIKRTLAPNQETLTLDGDLLILEQGDFRREIQAADLPGVAAFAASLRGFVSGQRAEVETAFTLVLEGVQERWIVKGTPRDSKVGAIVRTIHVDGNDTQLKRIEVKLTNGDVSTLTLLK